MALWLNENFLLQEDVHVAADEKLEMRFLNLRGAGMVFLEMEPTGEVYGSFVGPASYLPTTYLPAYQHTYHLPIPT